MKDKKIRAARGAPRYRRRYFSPTPTSGRSRRPIVTSNFGDRFHPEEENDLSVDPTQLIDSRIALDLSLQSWVRYLGNGLLSTQIKSWLFIFPAGRDPNWVVTPDFFFPGIRLNLIQLDFDQRQIRSSFQPCSTNWWLKRLLINDDVLFGVGVCCWISFRLPSPAIDL